MRLITFILFIFLLLSGGSTKIFANNSINNNCSVSFDKISKSRPLKVTQKTQNSILLQDTEIDLEEEFNQTHRFKNNNLTKLDFEKYQFSNEFYSILIAHLRLDHFLNKNKNFGLPNPIYITLQVLRI